MKQQDIAVIIIIVFIGGVASFFVSGWLFGGEKATFTTTVVDPIVVDFPAPDERYFNASSIDPTRVIEIGDNSAGQGLNGQ